MAPTEDAAFIEAVARIAIATYAGDGLRPFGVIHTQASTMMVPADDLSTEEMKREFVNIMRYLSIEHTGMRSAFAMESWTMFSRKPEDVALMDEIRARGGSMSEHPNVGEAIYVIVESDAGTTTRLHRILRSGDVVTLENGVIDFLPRADPTKPGINRGLFSNFHVPTGLRSEPAAQDYAAEMRELVPSRISRIPSVDDPTDSIPGRAGTVDRRTEH